MKFDTNEEYWIWYKRKKEKKILDDFFGEDGDI